MNQHQLSRRDFLRISAGVVGAVAVTGCVQQGGAPAEGSPAGETVEITVIGRDITIPTVLKLAEEWMADKQIKVTPLEIGGGLDQKMLESLATHTFLADVQLHDVNYGADLYSQGYYLPVDELVKEAIKWEDIVPIYRERIAAWQGTTYGIPYDGDNLSMAYRRDIMEDTDNQSKFADKYGYAMNPETGPTTWEEHRHYAEYFTGWDWNKDGDVSYGFAHMWKREGGSFWAFISRAAAYAKHPDVPDFFFKIQTGDPLINTEPFVRALTEWIDEMEKYAPPGAANMQWGDCLNLWKVGRVAMVNWWGDHGKDAQDKENSKIRGKMGFHLTPGSKEVYNQKTNAWETMEQVSYAPYLGYGGRCWGVAADTQHAEACWEFLKFACSPEITLEVSRTPMAGMEPVRLSQFNIDDWVNSAYQWDPKEAEMWLGTLKDNITRPNIVPDLRVPGFDEYLAALELAVSIAATREGNPQDALDQCAQTWRDVTDRVGGAEKQMKYYEDIAKSV